MEQKKVFIIAGEHYPVKKIVEELVAEEYPFKFTFVGYDDVLAIADEVWVFGNITGAHEKYLYNLAERMNKSIWVMG